MTFRADFYLGRGPRALWLGSLREHGAPIHLQLSFKRCVDQRDFYAVTQELVTSIPDGVAREQGWPWAYSDSSQTDYTYAYDRGQLYISCYGSPWVAWQDIDHTSLLDDYDYDAIEGDDPVFADMFSTGLCVA